MKKSIKFEKVNTFKTLDGTKYQLHFDIDFFVEEKQTVLIKGPSGNGKSLFGRLICQNDIFQTQGLISSTFTNPVFQMQNTRASIAKTITLKQYIDQFRNGIQIEELEAIFKSFDLDYFEVIRRNVFDLSGGEYLRFNTILSLLSKPDLLVLDEPSSALDKLNIELLMKGLIQMQSNNNFALIVISHDPYFESVIKSVFVMNKGRLSKLK